MPTGKYYTFILFSSYTRSSFCILFSTFIAKMKDIYVALKVDRRIIYQSTLSVGQIILFVLLVNINSALHRPVFLPKEIKYFPKVGSVIVFLA